MEDIIGVIKAFKEDHPEILITNEMIKTIIEDYMDDLIEEIREEI